MIATFLPTEIKVLAFDVDDTLTRDTIQTKALVWQELFSGKLTRLEEARKLYEYTGKGDRYNIIAHVLEVSQGGCKENQAVIEVAQQFEQLSQQRIREKGIHADDCETLKQLQSQFTDAMYIISVTPQEVVENNVRFFEQSQLKGEVTFVKVFGTPLLNGKAGALATIATERCIKPDTILMIGDGQSDYDGASGAGTQFVGVVPAGKNDRWPHESFPKIQTISELPKLLV